MGRGIILVNKDDDLTTVKKLLIEDDYLLEECIVNDEEIKKLNPSSLNTFRAYTHITNEGDAVLDELMLRVGKAGNHVDNWGQGGIGYYIDLESGIVTKPGLDKDMHEHLYHPGSNIQMIGYRIERIEELKNYILSLARSHPAARVVGWDVALTPKGFDFIEFNCPGGHDFLQAFGKPFWDVFKKIR